MALLLGGNSPTPGFTDRGKAAAEVFGPDVMLWLPSASPDNARQYPNCLHLVRLDNWRKDEGPLPYCARVEPTVTAWRDVPNVVFVLGNEPDREAGHMGQDFPLFAQNFRARFTGTKVANPPLSVEKTIDLSSHVTEAADYVLCHSSWETFAPQDIRNIDLGASYRDALIVAGGKPVIVSEVNAVTTREGATVDWKRRNQQVAQWLDQAEADGVYGACLFILDGNVGGWATFDVGPEAAQEILSLRAKPAPPPHPTNSPLRFKGRSVNAIKTMIVDGSAPARMSPFYDTVPDIIAACQEWNLDEAAMIAWTTSENNNATNISTGLLNAHNGAGIKFVGQPRASSGALAKPPLLAPASEGSVPYCVFGTWADFFWVLARNIVTLLPDAYEAGDLNRIAWYYTTGKDDTSGGTHPKEKIYEQFAAYPNDGPTPTPAPVPPPTPPPSSGIPLSRIRDIATQHIGKTLTDEGVPEFGMCEQEFEEWCEEAGLPRTRYASAAADGDVHLAKGDLHSEVPPPPGAGLLFGRRFDPEGHICAADDYPFVITTYPGSVSRVDAVANGWYASPGFLGHFIPDGATPDGTQSTEGIPVGDGFNADEIKRLWYGTSKPTKTMLANFPYNPDFGIEQTYAALANGTFAGLTGRSVVLGPCISKEEFDPGTPGRSIRYFQNGKITALRQADGTYQFVLD